MAFRRSVTARAKLLYQRQRQFLPLSKLHLPDDDNDNIPRHHPISTNPSETPNYNFQRRPRPFGVGTGIGSFLGSRNLFQHHNISADPAAVPVVLHRNMSTLGEWPPADKTEIMTEMVDALGDKAADVASQAGPVVNEVAVAAADSFLPVAAAQHLVDFVHIYSGFDWWASIALTTVLIRMLQLPISIYQLKAMSKLALLRPQLKKISEEVSRDTNPTALAEGQERMKKLFKEYGVTPLTPFRGILIVGPVLLCFFFAILNMAENVQSFKDGGILWFTDLATPDPLYILPVLTALTLLINVEFNFQDGMEGIPSSGKIKNFFRVLSVLTIPFTLTFPKAVFFYWITSNLYSLAYGLVLKNPEVKKMLGIPIVPASTPSTDDEQASRF